MVRTGKELEKLSRAEACVTKRGTHKLFVSYHFEKGGWKRNLTRSKDEKSATSSQRVPLFSSGFCFCVNTRSTIFYVMPNASL